MPIFTIASRCSADAPERLVALQEGRGVVDDHRVPAHQLLAAPALLAHKACPLEHGDVLLHRGEAHRVGPRQFRDRSRLLEYPHDDVAPRPVGQGVEHLVDALFEEIIYNHLVAG